MADGENRQAAPPGRNRRNLSRPSCTAEIRSNRHPFQIISNFMTAEEQAGQSRLEQDTAAFKGEIDEHGWTQTQHSKLVSRLGTPRRSLTDSDDSADSSGALVELRGMEPMAPRGSDRWSGAGEPTIGARECHLSTTQV